MLTAYGMDLLASVGREGLGTVKAHFSSVGECMGIEVGVGGWEEEHPHRSRGRGRERKEHI